MAKSTMEGYLKASTDWFNKRWAEIPEVLDWNSEWIRRVGVDISWRCDIPIDHENPSGFSGLMDDIEVNTLPYDKQYKTISDFGLRCIIHNTPLGPVVFYSYPNGFTDGEPDRFVCYAFDARLRDYGFLASVGFIDPFLLQHILGNWYVCHNDITTIDPARPLLLGQMVQRAFNYHK